MPELPEVEVLCGHLAAVLPGRRIRRVVVRRPKAIAPLSSGRLGHALRDATFARVTRRAKYLVVELRRPCHSGPIILLVHLGMTGRLYVRENRRSLPPHVSVVLDLGGEQLIFQDPRGFGRLTLDLTLLTRLGPEPLARRLTATILRRQLGESRQPIKVRLMDQRVIAGIGNIYASEILFHARIHPLLPTCKLQPTQVVRLRQAIRSVLRAAIRFGSTVPLSWDGHDAAGRLFYYGRSPNSPASYDERLQVYDRAGECCSRCPNQIQKVVLGGRSTYFCPSCQL